MLNDVSDEEDEYDIAESSVTASLTSSFVLFGPTSFTIHPAAFPVLNANLVAGLCDVYLYRIDPMFKVLHEPSLRSFLQHDQLYLDYAAGHIAPQTLKHAVLYTATMSLSNDEFQAMFGRQKDELASKLEFATKMCLARANFTTTNDITVLQAFTIYLVGQPAAIRMATLC